MDSNWRGDLSIMLVKEGLENPIHRNFPLRGDLVVTYHHGCYVDDNGDDEDGEGH